MIPAGDFDLNASLVLGRLTILIEEAGRIGICSDHVFWGPRTTFDQVYKGHCGETPRSLFFGGFSAGGRNLYAI